MGSLYNSNVKILRMFERAFVLHFHLFLFFIFNYFYRNAVLNRLSFQRKSYLFAKIRHKMFAIFSLLLCF